MKIIVINGQGGSGKDTFVNYCKKYSSVPIYNLSMVSGVKNLASQIGWDGGKTLKDRKFLSDLKDLLDEYNDFPFNNVVESIKIFSEIYEGRNAIFFIHAREIKDISRWVNSYNALTVLIRRKEEKIYGNHADDDVFNIDYDYYIDNDSTLEALEEKAKEFIEKIIDEFLPWGSNYVKLP